MQQRGFSTSMENDNFARPLTPPPSRARHNSKLKVLVRSHAMREETSPPREPSPSPLISPCIKLIPSPKTSPVNVPSVNSNPMVVLSPSLSRGTSPCRSPNCSSPTSTLVPSPNSRCSPVSASPQHSIENEKVSSYSDTELVGSPKYLNRLNKQNLEKDPRRDYASHLNNNNKKKFICDCPTQNCIKCSRNQERNINNNLTNNNSFIGNTNMLTVSRANSRGKLRQQSSSQGSFEGSSSTSPCLSRDSSSEQYTDTSGIDLEQFIPETLNRNAKDRAFMLRIEQELVSLAKDRFKTHYKFSPMSSYQRMLVHRCAAYFGMDHNIESSGKCVVVNKTKNTRIPDVEFKEHIKEDIVFSEEPRRSILKRDSNSMEDYNFKSPDRQHNMDNRKSKSFEEREEEYEKKLCLLHQMDYPSSQDEYDWAEHQWSSTDSENSSRFRLQPPDLHRKHFGKLIKVQSEEAGETLRPYVAKSFSFGGYGGALNRGDSVISSHSAGPRLLTKQDSAASSISYRLSPSSSGYKSQSQMSESVTPSPTSTPHPQLDSNGVEISHDKDSCDTPIVWAVTNMQRVPKGSIIINPQTGETIRNDDGTLYHYDPNNPPGFVTSLKPPLSPKKSSNSPQKMNKERSQSPKKRSNKFSPNHKSHVTNSSTSPTLPYSSPSPQIHQQNRNFQFISGLGESIPNIPQQYSMYGNGFAAPSGDGLSYFQHPYFVYTTQYGVPPHFDSRLEPAQNDVTGSYFVNVTDNSVTPSAQNVSYSQQPTPYYTQQPITFYQNPTNSTPPQRFPVPLQPQGQTGYLPASFPQNYLPPPPPPQNPELVPMYPNQPIQMVYPTQPSQGNSVVYPNPSNLIFAQNPIYSNPVYVPPNIPQYPQNTSTPNSMVHTDPNFMQLAQNMAQMNLSQGQVCQTTAPPLSAVTNHHQNYLSNKMSGSTNYDVRQKNGTPKGNKFGVPKSFLFNSSQSSTGTNSPAATVVAGYCPQQNPGLYRTPSETPPNQFNYGPTFPIPPVLFRQMSNVRTSTPGTARNSRSPTPASDISHFERQRIPLPPPLYHGMPYVIQSDTRLIPGRGQPTAYRQQSQLRQQNFHQSCDNNNRSHKGRKSKVNNKTSSLPPNGKSI